MRARIWAVTGIVCLAGLSAFAEGCSERDPISRVGANVMPKKFFVGNDLQKPDDDPEFRMKSYTPESSVSQSVFTIGEFSALDRVRWEIQEDMLIARRAYQEVDGADNRGVPKSQWSTQGKSVVKTPTGTIVAAYRIQSHFDVRRAYNPQTGEELNIVEENSNDRPWYQREFMRVDWSQNLVSSTEDYRHFFELGKITPVSYAPTDPSDENAPHVEVDNGYLDVTNKFTVDPVEIQMPWGSIKECVLASIVTGSASYDCNPQEATIRTSFAKIDPNEDFERFEDTKAWRDVVGNWGGSGDGVNPWLGAPRSTWDPGYGATDANTHRFKAIHNIWVKSHQAATCSSNDDADKNGTADACENAITGYKGHGGSQCDVYEQKCTIPVRDRTVKTIAYHFNKDAPQELQDKLDANGNPLERGTLEDLLHSWNQLMSVSVAYRREVECRRTGDGDRDACHAEFFESDLTPAGKEMVSFGGWLVDKVKPQAIDQGHRVITSCHNPVRAYDQQDACGKTGDVARYGDVRKNFLVYWPYESRARYGGIGANPPDPLTGETWGASATIMGRSATMASAMQRDIIALALGDLTMNDIIQGVPADRYAAMLKAGAPSGLTKGLTQQEIDRKIGALDMNHLRSSAQIEQLDSTNTLAKDLAEARLGAKTIPDLGAITAQVASYGNVASKLRGTNLESSLVDSHWLVGALGANPQTAITPDLLELASPLRGLDPMRLDLMNSWYTNALAEHGACFDDSQIAAGPGSAYLASLAGFFKQKYGDLDPKTRGERIYQDLWREAVKGIGLHELGHSLGLRHNFASSWDAPNFTPQYWQLRTGEGSAFTQCTQTRTGDVDSCIGPRYLDPMTKDEQGLAQESRPAIDYYANTSTMEYHQERFGETIGLGTYDLHAMKTLYGRVLEAFDEGQIPASQAKNIAPKTYTQLQERDLVLRGQSIFSHYTSTARTMKVFDPQRDCREATDEEKARGAWRVVHGKVCSPSPKDHWSFDDYRTEEIQKLGINGVRWHAFDHNNKEYVRWPYRYGEQYGSGGYVHTSMSDAGADVYELVQNLQQRFDMTYPWMYFRRGSRDYSHLFLPQATVGRYLSRLHGYHWVTSVALGRGSPTDIKSDDGLRPYALAQSDMFNALTRMLMLPEPGDYTQSQTRTSPEATRNTFDIAGFNQTKNFTVGIVDGRYIGEEFDNDLGGSWDYTKYVSHAGFEVEKAFAMMQLIDSRPTLFTIARDNFLDGRGIKVNFRSDLPDAVDRVLGGVLSEDWETVAPQVTDMKTGIPEMFDMTVAQPSRPQNAAVLFPNIGYKQQLQVGIFAMLFSRLGTDMTLTNKMRVWLDGDLAPQLEPQNQTRFTDPQTHYTYVAERFGNDTVADKVVDRGVGSRMIAHANALVASAYQVQKDGNGKPVLDSYGRPQIVLQNGQPVVLDSTRDSQLRKYIGLIDSMREVARAFTGPLGGGVNDN